MKNGLWPDVVHLLCRWHVYEAIKRYCIPFFKKFEKGKQQEQLNGFITAFKNIVCAPSETQMKALWRSFIEDDVYPREAIDYVKREYYESSKAMQIMECYVYNSGNLHQITTSRNEGMHGVYRSKTSVIQKPAESYLLRRSHKEQWMRRLRSQAMNGRNRIPLDLSNTPELQNLNRKIGLFALTEIKRQIILAKKEDSEGIIHTWVQTCGCHAARRYGLRCYHIVPTNGDAIPLHSIAPFWRLDNGDEGMQLDYSMLTNLELTTNIEDARLTVYSPNFPANNISLRDIQHASQLNNTIPFSDRLRGQLNDATRARQSLDLQEKLA
jgi:hypothetical protein